MGEPLLVILTGPSGAGKDAILSALKARPNTNYSFPPNATNRPPRPGEEDGVDYLFVSDEEFARMVRDDELLEHATVYGQQKGIPKAPIRDLLSAGRTVLLRTDIQGARYVKSAVPDAVTIFVAPPSAAELAERMLSRGGDSKEQVEVRLRTAQAEMQAAGEFDQVVVNDDLEHCVDEIEEIIVRERERPDREPIRI